MRKLILGFATVVVLCSLPFQGTTNAVLFDAENSNGNLFSASSLDFSLRKTDNTFAESPFFNVTDVRLGFSETKTVKVKKEGVLDFAYSIRAESTGGDSGFCKAVNLKASLGEEEKYNGSLEGLNFTSPFTISSSGEDQWTFILSFNGTDESLKNKTCDFNIIFRGWQLDSNGTWGFIDEEILGNSAASGDWTVGSAGDVVINELMWMGTYDFEESDLANDEDEWIELRNTTDHDINLSGWYLTNLSGTMFTIPNGKIIPANGFFVISHFDAEKSKIKDRPDLVVGDQLVFDDKNLQIKLYDFTGQLIDPANDGGVPAAGSKGVMLNMSMERNNDPKTGWHTCMDQSDEVKAYWDSGVEDRGTPGGQNLSENDLSEKTALPQEPEINFSLRQDKKAVSFAISSVAGYEKLTYDIVYDAKPAERGIFGEIPLNGEESVSREDLLLGTCSALKQYCVYDQGMTRVSLRVLLFKGSESKEIYKEIEYK